MHDASDRAKRIPVCTALLAHVDAGKTTLSEALLYESGAKKSLGRVDHQDAFLDTHALERARGITIFSKQALFSTRTMDITLLDTPGHVDFSAEAERVLPVLDWAILVISGTDGVQPHTRTLWELLERYQVPVFLFINKMDLPGADRQALLEQLQKRLSPGCLDFGVDPDTLAENAAVCDEALLETYLQTGQVTAGNLQGLIAHRQIFPCCFGSALRLEGVTELLQVVEAYAPRPVYGDQFAARVFKISRDPQGNRLTWMKITGGTLAVRTPICYTTRTGEVCTQKAVQLRRYSGAKFTTPDSMAAGSCCAVLGLTETYAGQALGAQQPSDHPILEPVMTYHVQLPKGCDPAVVLPKLRQLEEEDPMLCIAYDANLGQIQVRLMGQVQLEILKCLIRERFDLEVGFDTGRVFYKETIENTVEGVGHFEPLRHYAEVHLLLEPLPRGSGLVLDTVCPTEVLDVNYQKLILTHLEEKVHRGVLTGAPITDMKLTLLAGRAHLKHTEGGDFRQATYRAVRQGLMQARSVLLEPWYDVTLMVPTEQIGRAITDIRAMGGEFDPPEQLGEFSILKGRAPVSEATDYASQVAAYTHGRGQLQTRLWGYAPCHNAQAVMEAAGYDPQADLENTPDSVFCAHGAGFTVKWDQVPMYMHLESGLRPDRSAQPALVTRNLRVDDKELEAILLREFGPEKRSLYRPPENQPATEKLVIRPPRQTYLIVDGYNMIFAWDSLAAVAKTDLETARRQLLDRLSSFAGFRKWYVLVVFDGYKVKGNPGERLTYHNIQVVYTRENETGDLYIETLVGEIGGNYAVRVATSDAMVQLASFRSGVLRMSARELLEELETAEKELRAYVKKKV